MCVTSAHKAAISAAIIFAVVQTWSPSQAQERGIGIECARDQTPLAVTVCGDRTAAAAERRTTAAYLALYFSLDEAHRTAFRTEHMEWWNRLSTTCAPTPNPAQPNDGSRPRLALDCVTKALKQRSDSYRKRLSPVALDEANQSTAVQRKIQKRLVELKFLTGGSDGMFGANTRAAIKSYQASIGHPQGNFLTAEERTALLAPAPAAPLDQHSSSAAGPAPTASDTAAFALAPAAAPAAAPAPGSAFPPPSAVVPPPSVAAPAAVSPESSPSSPVSTPVTDPVAGNPVSKPAAPPEPTESRAPEAAPAKMAAAEPAADETKQSSPASPPTVGQERQSIAMAITPYVPLAAGVLAVLGIAMVGAFFVFRRSGRRQQPVETAEMHDPQRKEPRLPASVGAEPVQAAKPRLDLDGKTVPRRTMSA